MVLSLVVGFGGTISVLNGQILSDPLEDASNSLDLWTIVCITASTEISIILDLIVWIVLDV